MIKYNQYQRQKSRLTQFITLSVFLLTIILNSCSPDENEPLFEENIPVKEDPVWNIYPEGQAALNVVLFKPVGEKVTNAMLEDISVMMNFCQAWFGEQMKLQGYGYKTFGLEKNQFGAVKIHVVQGYDNNGGSTGEVNSDVKQYFSENPGAEKSEHTLVLGTGGVGFAGLGKWAHAASSNYITEPIGLYLGDLELRKKAGGVYHELGHGLNLPHNSYKVSEMPNVSLMGYGNSTFSKNPEKVFLTKSSCAILNVNPLFNRTDNGINYYGQQPSTKLNKIIINKDAANGSITIDAEFESNIQVTNTYVGFDFVNEGASHPNDNYDEITYAEIPTILGEGTYTVQFEVPYEDLFNGYQSGNKDEAEISLNIVCENGIKKVISTRSYTTNTSTMVPNDDILYSWPPVFNLLDRSAWTAQANSQTSEEDKSPNMLDGDYSTFWHSKWPYNIANNGAHEIIINMGSITDIKGVYLYSRRENNAQFRPKHIIVQTSADATTWAEQSNYTVESIAAAKEISIEFDQNVAVQYVKILVDEIYTDATNGAENLIICELSVL
ncbi:discoidin domain-containing protein [Carboxylicivirga marina]|uniref:Discoidin domain-containing protein n=1 Tax=Carboxylicivirga marina TaxID=2800988 RepID=A0ABS1HKS4_9BACT|nr:discoidin domain-containing protein [Carboxylicivirga marina]MBK3518283.1 discoidin domain-containing protein [Carboxylicivirga marina]